MQKTAFCCIQSATTGFTANAFPYHIRVSLKEAFEGPEPDDGKLSRPVLRGPAPSNGGWLLGDRMERSGMRWTEEMAEAIVQLRAIYLSGDFDRYWPFHIEKDQQRIHPRNWSVVLK